MIKSRLCYAVYFVSHLLLVVARLQLFKFIIYNYFFEGLFVNSLNLSVSVTSARCIAKGIETFSQVVVSHWCKGVGTWTSGIYRKATAWHLDTFAYCRWWGTTEDFKVKLCYTYYVQKPQYLHKFQPDVFALIKIKEHKKWQPEMSGVTHIPAVI